MRADIEAAERSREVRDAAKAWRRAGFVNASVESGVVSRYPDDRRRLGPGFRVLAFIFTGIAICALVGLSFLMFELREHSAATTLLLVWAILLAALTEVQRGPWRRASAGAESVSALMAVLFAVLAVVISFEKEPAHVIAMAFLASSCLFCTLAAWRCGDVLFFLGLGLSGFGVLTQTDHGRLYWILASLMLVPACIRGARSAGFSPSHRRGLIALGAVSILALYAAVHVWSFDQQAIESSRWVDAFDGSARTNLPFRPLAILGTALLPPILLLMGWRMREPLLLYAGLMLIGASIATIRAYYSVMPLSFALILVGASCLALALFVRRWLRSGEQGEQGGFTADPLFDKTNRTNAIKAAVAMASFTPAAQAAPSQPAFKGEGGSFGGGGATGNF